MIEFRTLGALDLRRADGPELDSLVAQPKRIGLLAYLCLARPHGFHRRDTLLGLFWPDSDQTRARASLRRALHVLRLSLGEDALPSRGDEEIAANSNLIWCDAGAFEERLAANKVVEALELYRGDLLPGFFLDELPSFERWLDETRTYLRSLASSAARLAAEASESERNFTDAVHWARRAVELAENDERAVRGLVEVLERAGDRAGALQVYDDFVTRLAAELEAEPSLETRALADRLRSKGSGNRPKIEEQPKAALQALERMSGAHLEIVQEFPDPLASSVTQRSSSSRRSSIRRGVAVAGVLLISVAAVASLHSFAAPTTGAPAARRKLTFNGNITQGILSPDGQFLAYVAQERDSNRLIVQDLTGGPADTMLAFPRQAVDHTIEWSPNSARILMKQGGKVVLIHRHGGSPQQQVRGFQVGDDARWFPDGRVSLSNLPKGRLVVMNLETGDSLPIHIPRLRGIPFDGSWSRDGRELAVVTNSLDSVRWVINGITLDGRIEPLVEDSVPLNSPRWADGNVLYYLRGADAIWRAHVSPQTGKVTGRAEKIESGIDALPGNIGLAHFSLSRDGHQLVYAKGERFSNIYRVEPIDSIAPPHMERLTTGVSLKWSPVVSPDGQWIAFAAQTKDGSELFRMPIDGGRTIQISQGARIWPRSEIAWSPDGQQIAFQTVRAGRSQIWLAAVSSGEMRGFPNINTSIRTTYLTWAPGSRIVYGLPDVHLRVLDPTTSRDELLVADTAGTGLHYPRYSPTGKEIAMTRWRRGERNLVSILRIADGTDTRLPTALVFPRGWSADGRFIFAQIPFVPKIVRLDASGKKPPEAVFTAPVREMECTPDPSRHRLSFICMMFDFSSDIWMIEDLDRGSD
jgi:DNA-binding SARP family transcriptional activator/Tol biopolymer transport system component